MGLSNNCLTCQDVKQLATGWPRLTSLDLSGNHVGSDGVSTIVHSHWSGLQRLALGWCALTDAFLPILVKGKWLQFVSVDLQHNEFTCPMMDCLAEASWPALQEFNLHLVTSATHNMMSDGLLLIFSKLEALNLGNHWLWGQSLERPSNMHWSHLRSIVLTNCFCGFTHTTVDLLNTVTWPLIKSLDLRRHEICGEFITALHSLSLHSCSSRDFLWVDPIVTLTT